MAEFLGGFSTIFLQGRVVSPTPNPHPGGYFEYLLKLNFGPYRYNTLLKGAEI
jgi:hypothetical protein